MDFPPDFFGSNMRTYILEPAVFADSFGGEALELTTEQTTKLAVRGWDCACQVRIGPNPGWRIGNSDTYEVREAITPAHDPAKNLAIFVDAWT